MPTIVQIMFIVVGIGWSLYYLFFKKSGLREWDKLGAGLVLFISVLSLFDLLIP